MSAQHPRTEPLTTRPPIAVSKIRHSRTKPFSTSSRTSHYEPYDIIKLYNADEAEKPLPVLPFFFEEDRSHVQPEGGYGWVVVLASFGVHAIVNGLQTSFGVFQAAYKQPGAFPDATTSSIALISAVGAASSPVFGIAIGRFSEILGFRAMAVIGAVILPVGLFLASFAQEIWHLILTQGVIYGLGAGCIYYPALTVLTHYFYKRRGLAMGIAVSGSGIGGLILAPVTQRLIDGFGWRRAIQILALICFIVLACSAAALKPLIPAKKKGGLDFTVFKDGIFLRLYLLGVFMTFGYLIPYTFLVVQAKTIGVSLYDAATCILVANGLSAVGRVTLGYLGDKIGQIHILILSSMVSSLSLLLLWPLAHSFATLLAFSTVYGFFSGAFFAAFPLVTAQFFGESRLSSVAGMLFSCYAIGFLGGAPIAGALVDAIKLKNVAQFRPAMFFAGTTIGCACMVASCFLQTLSFWSFASTRFRSSVFMTFHFPGVSRSDVSFGSGVSFRLCAPRFASFRHFALFRGIVGISEGRFLTSTVASESRHQPPTPVHSIMSRLFPPINIQKWAEEHSHLLQPPVANCVVQKNGLIVMAVGGPNKRTDYHVNPTDEWFYQLKGDMLLKVVDDGEFKDITIKEGETMLLPGNVPHSPVRFENTVGLVIERSRPQGQNDRLRWYCRNCKHILYEENFYCHDLGTQLEPVIEKFASDVSLRSCKHCGTVNDAE